MISDSVNIYVDPFLVVSDDLSSVHPAENAARSAVFRLGSVAVEEAEMHLTFVTVHLFSGNAAEKDARVESFSVDVDVKRQVEIGVAKGGFQRSVPVFDGQFAVFVDAGVDNVVSFPVTKVFPVKELLRQNRFNGQSSDADRSLIQFDADEPASEFGHFVNLLVGQGDGQRFIHRFRIFEWDFEATQPFGVGSDQQRRLSARGKRVININVEFTELGGCSENCRLRRRGG